MTENESKSKNTEKGAPVRGQTLPPGPLRSIALAFATGFGTGYAPKASGTVGSLVAIPLFWFMTGPYGGWFGYIVATALLIILSIQVSTVAEKVFGRKDDGRVVIDEIVGYLVTMLFAPHTFKAVIVGFVLSRFFDVIKPYPAKQLQSLKGGVGIVVDDLIAGVYAFVCMQILCWIGWI